MSDTELLSRTRRIETRLTQLCVAMGVGTQAQKPTFDPGSTTGPARLSIPSRHSSLQEIISAIPEGWTNPVELVIGDNRIGTVVLGGN